MCSITPQFLPVVLKTCPAAARRVLQDYLQYARIVSFTSNGFRLRSARIPNFPLPATVPHSPQNVWASSWTP
eukprot:492414-Pleurochrysis_carterae.AAC.1